MSARIGRLGAKPPVPTEGTWQLPSGGRRQSTEDTWQQPNVGTGFSLSSRPAAGVTTHALYVIPRRKAPLAPSLFIGDHRWPHVKWTTMRSTRGVKMVGLADLETLPPGQYATEVRFLGRVIAERRLERLRV